MRRALWIIMLVSGSVLVASVATLIRLGTRQMNSEPQPVTASLTPDQTVDDLQLTSFALVDQDGDAATEAIFLDRITILDFIFTRCPFICPTMTAALLDLQDRLKTTDVRFVSISVDPEHDTPEVLHAYATEREGDLRRWSLLTGDKQQIWAMLRDGLRWGIQEDPSTPIINADGSSMANINHPGWFALIGPEGQVLGIFRHSDPEDISALAERARQAAADVAARKPPPD